MSDDFMTGCGQIVRRPPPLETIYNTSNFLDAADLEEVLLSRIVWFGYNRTKPGQGGLEADGSGKGNRNGTSTDQQAGRDLIWNQHYKWELRQPLKQIALPKPELQRMVLDHDEVTRFAEHLAVAHDHVVMGQHVAGFQPVIHRRFGKQLKPQENATFTAHLAKSRFPIPVQKL